MKRFLTAVSLLLACATSFGATLNPIQLLNPVGSTSGQVISSTGPATAPAWSTITASSVGGLTATNNLSDLVSAAVARTNLGLGTAATVNTGTSGATIPLLNGANTWAAAQTFSVRPTFNGATPYDSANLTIANYAPLASPAFTGSATFNGAAPALTTGNLSQFASTTSAQLATLLSDETGSGSAVFSLTPTITAPNVIGTISGGNAAAGSVGELINPAATTGTSITTATATNCASTSLTAGDWDVQAMLGFTPAPTTTVSRFQAGVSTTSAAFGSFGTYSSNPIGVPGSGPALNSYAVLPSPVVRVSISSTTTVYAIGVANFATSTMTCDGFIRARRVR